MEAIPKREAPRTYNRLQDSASCFVRIPGNVGLDVRMQYPLLKMENAVDECYVRQEVFEKLLLAQSLLPQGFRLRIWDGWRPFALQQELYEKYSQRILAHFSLSNAPAQEQQRLIAQYVSYPNDDPLLPPVHTTGGAVDVTLLGPDGEELNMGSSFDSFTEAATTDYFEHPGADPAVRENRRLLFHCMTAAGFENLPSEWWHYGYGDSFWAYYRNTPALYKGIYTVEELKRNEKKTEKAE